MKDEDVLTRVRDGFAPLRMSMTEDDVMARGEALRRRGRRGRLAAGGALALALAAGLGVPALTARGSGAPQRTTLAAWTVNQRPGGSIAVTIRELRDLPALQAQLSADGARVAISDTALSLPRGCVAPGSSAQMPAGMITFGAGHQPGGYAFTIRPQLIPGHQELLILVIPGPFRSTPPVTTQNGAVTVHGGPVQGAADPGVFFTLVQDSARCTS
jgi:hypothetical protein